MTRGLLWLPLLIAFIALAWAGWNEYQKLEAYRVWATQFDRAKYDIYAVLGQKSEVLTWGKPTRRGMINLTSFSLRQVNKIQLSINHQIRNDFDLPEQTGAGRQVFLSFQLEDDTVNIPFTDSAIAAAWGKFLQQEWLKLQSNTDRS